MAQFDVYENTNTDSRIEYPLLLDIQYSVLSVLTTRIVVPLCQTDSVVDVVMDTLMPTILFAELQYVLMTPQISGIPARMLRNPVGTLEHSRAEVLAALDFAITGI